MSADPEAGPPRAFGEANARRISGMLDLDEERAAIVRGLFEDRQRVYEDRLLVLLERESDLVAANRRSLVRDHEAELQRLTVERAALVDRIADEVLVDVRVLLSDEELRGVPALRADRVRRNGLKRLATFFQETLDPVEITEAIGAGAVETPGVREMLESYTVGVRGLIETRDAAATRLQAFANSEEDAVMDEAGRRVPECAYAGRLERAAEDAWNTSLKIGELNVRTLGRVRALLGESDAAAMDKLVASLARENRGAFPGDVDRVLFLTRVYGRFTRLLEELGYEGGAGLTGHTLTAEQREALAPIVEAFEGEMVRAMASMRDAFLRSSNAAMYMDISTPGGSVHLYRDYDDVDESAQERASELREAAWAELKTLAEIDQRAVVRLRELLTVEQRWAVARY